MGFVASIAFIVALAYTLEAYYNRRYNRSK